MSTAAEIPAFAAESWYSDPTDHRCPHDAWLESCEIREAWEGERSETGRTVITVRLLGAYHDGHIVFRYSSVERFAISSEAAASGLRDWVADQFSVVGTGVIRHDIIWAGQGPTAQWSIDARQIEYEWIPKAI